MWAKLQLIHKHDASESIHALQQKFYKCTLSKGESIASFVTNIEVVVNRLISRGNATFTERTIIAKLISSLPARYNNVLSAWDTTPEASKTLDTLTLHMYQHEARFKNRQISVTEKIAAYAATSSKNSSSKDGKNSQRL